MVAAYAKAWPDAEAGRNIEDRADAAHAAALGAAWLGVPGLPQSTTAVRTTLLSKLPEPTLPPRPTAPVSDLAGTMTAVKWIPDSQTLELTARNVTALLEKLDDPLSARTLYSPCGQVMVTAVESAGTAAAAASSAAVIPVTRRQLDELATRGATIHVAGVTVVSVPDAAHYRDRAPGPVAMPSTGEVW